MVKLKRGWLRRARRNKRLTLAQVARVLGKNRSTVWRYENEHVSVSVDVLLKLADLYGVELNSLIGEE